MLMINSEKMSKSLGNFFMLKDVLEKYPARIIRLFMLQTHYRSPLDFSDARLEEAAATEARILSFIQNISWAAENEKADASLVADPATNSMIDRISATRSKFEAEMDDDFNSAGALGAIFELIRDGNSLLASRSAGDAASLTALVAARDLATELLAVLGLDYQSAESAESYPQEFIELAREICNTSPANAQEALDMLLDARAEARANKNWALADAVRDGFAALGYLIEDTSAGARVKVK